jgi:pimeloyl-ACP methyl ester carboxylesterase
MVTGVSVTEADCRAQIDRLWVKVEKRGFCVRFWLSTAGGSTDEALVAFHGDIGGRIDGKLQLVEQARPISDESLQKVAGYGSRLYRGPYFFIARPGAFGSSGQHVKDRRTLLEIRVAMAALDALKQHYGFKRFHLLGHSGGGHTVAGLVQLRSDIGCAVIASASLSLRSALWYGGHPPVEKHRFYDPIDHVSAMRQRPGLRLFVVSDRNDKIAPYRSQLEFVERVKAHNLPITHVTATATDKNSHDLFDHGLRLAADCANPEREAERAWAFTKDTTTIAVLEAFVRRYGDSRYAALARARMEELRKSQAAAQTNVLPFLPTNLPKIPGEPFLPTIVPKIPGTSSRVLAPSPTTANPNPQLLVPPAAQPVAWDDTLDDFPLPPPSSAPPAAQPVAVPIERPEQTKTPPSARGSEVPAVPPQPVSAEPRERERKAAEPRRASVERPHSKPALAPRQAKPRGSIRRCFVIGGRSFCE